MKFVLIGTGNVAWTFGTLLHKAGHELVQVYGRRLPQAAELAVEWGAAAVDQLSSIHASADVYIIAVSDDAIAPVCDGLRLPGKLVLHTAGAVTEQVLLTVSERTGVLYPLQSLRKGHLPEAGIPLLVHACEQEDAGLLLQLAATFGYPAQLAGDTERKNYHLAAVWANNFPNLLFSITYRMLQEKGLAYAPLVPLIRETAGRIDGSDPWKWQTGPAKRKDAGTLERHLQLLQAHPQWQEIYRLLSRNIAALTEAAE